MIAWETIFTFLFNENINHIFKNSWSNISMKVWSENIVEKLSIKHEIFNEHTNPKLID